MSYVDLRVFQCIAGYDANGVLVVEDITQDRQGPHALPVQVVDVVRMNALAALLRKPLAYHVLRHELLLLLSYISTDHNGDLTVHSADLRSSARHIGAFFSEAIGLGMLTAAVREKYGWRASTHDSLANFDILPMPLATEYLTRGVRPDLLFQFPAGAQPQRLAGEARGRSDKRPRKASGSAEQRHRLNQILSWSQRHGHHPVTMTWTYTAPRQVQVDLFTVTLPTTLRQPAQNPVPPTDPPPPSPPTPPKSPDKTSPGSSSGAPHETPPQPPNAGSRLPFSRLNEPIGEDYRYDERSYARAEATQTIDLLYDTAPGASSELRELWGTDLRGEWAPANLFGQQTAQLFLGVLPAESNLDLQTAIHDRDRGRPTDEHEDDLIQIDLSGRLLMIVSLEAGSPPSWAEIATHLF